MKIVQFIRSEKRFWIELALVMVIQLVPRYFVTPGVPESPFVLTLNSGLLFVYILVNYQYLGSISKPVFLLATAHFLTGLGFFSTENLTDFLFPLRDSFFTLAILGVFSQKYNENRYINAIAAVCVILMPFIIWKSAARNHLDLFAKTPTRFGMSLLGYFMVILTYYSLQLFRGRYKFFLLIPLALVILTSSRAALAGAFFICAVYFLTVTHIRRGTLIKISFMLLIFILVSSSIGLLFGADLYHHMADLLNRSSHDLNYFDTDRTNQWAYWANYLFDNPSILGHGLVTYAQSDSILYYPHNTYMHILIGGGLLGGTLYLLACFSMLLNLFTGGPWQKYGPEFVLARAFLLFLLFRGIFEIEVVGTGFVHVVSIFTAYGFGAGLYKKSPLAARVRYGKRAYMMKPAAVWLIK